jgi:hypothetical protein
MPLAVAFYSRTAAIAFAEKEVCLNAKHLRANIVRILNIKMNIPATANASVSRAPRASEFAQPVGYAFEKNSGVTGSSTALMTKRTASILLHLVNTYLFRVQTICSSITPGLNIFVMLNLIFSLTRLSTCS